MAKHGKNYLTSVKDLGKTQVHEPQEAIEMAKQLSYAKFDETVELHLAMGVDPRNASQQVRGVALLPHGLGKQVRIVVFAQGEAARIAEGAGADHVGDDVQEGIAARGGCGVLLTTAEHGGRGLRLRA